MARICIVTPSPLGSNPRVVKEAQALQQHGHSVHVIAPRLLDYIDLRDEDILADATWSHDRIDFRNRRLWRARRLGQLAARAVHAVSGLAASAANSAMAPVLAARARARPADLYIAHYVAALPAAAMAARRHGALYAFDAEDFHLGDLPDTPEHAGEKKLIRAIESRWLPGCAYVSAASPGIAAAYQREYGLPTSPTTILNVFPRSTQVAAPTPKGTVRPGPSVYWVSQTIGADRGLEAAVEAIGLARSRPHLYLRGVLAAGFEDVLRRRAAAIGVGDRLHLLPPCLPSEMTAMAAVHDVGLTAETGYTRNHRIALANKQFTYFMAGLPVVLSDIPAHRDFAGLAPGATRLYDVDNPAALAAALDDLLCEPSRLVAARSDAYELGRTKFNWDIEQLKLFKCVDSALANGKIPLLDDNRWE